MCRLQQMNEQAEMPDYNEKGQLIYDAIVEKLKMAPSLYVLLDKATGLPYIIEGTRSWQNMPCIFMRTSTINL